MNPELQKKVHDHFIVARDKALAANSHTRFGETEQAAVVEAMVDLLVNDADVAAEGYDAIRLPIAAVLNASAFAQKLEANGKITRQKKGKTTAKGSFAE